MKKSLNYFLFAAATLGALQFSVMSAQAQTTVSTYNSEPDFLAPASATATTAAAGAVAAQAGAGAATGNYQNTTQTSGANEYHTQVLNPTSTQNLGLPSAGTGLLAPIFY